MKTKLPILDTLSSIYRKYIQGKANLDEKELVEKSTEIILNGNNSVDESVVGLIAENVYHSLDRQIKKRRRKTQMLKLASSVAAIAVFSFLLWQYLPQTTQVESNILAIQTTDNQLKDVTLSDGTVISLNYKTKIRYDNNSFNKENREIWLSGEAFFDVTKNPEKPFIIYFDDFSIQVLGTSFNVKSYAEFGKYVVSVRDGTVDIHKGKQQLGILTKNKELTYHLQTDEYDIIMKDCNGINLWSKGMFVLSNTSLEEFAIKMKQHYNLNVEIMEQHTIPSAMINGIYEKTDNPESIIKSICLLYNLKYTNQHGEIIISPR